MMGSIEIPKRDFDVIRILQQLTVDEKISLLSGSDPWHTAPIPRLGIPKIRLTDGPNGVRGTKFFNGVPAACLPCGTGLAATWDIDLIRQGGALQGAEALAKGASVILGPTMNMQRGPLGGRGFESFSEDPVLAGEMAAATIQGIQSVGVAATPKHFVCNDQEHERQSVDAIVSQRALREIYLMPFQIAQLKSDPMCYMTAYNRVNGTHASDSTYLIRDILRDEWGFDGLVMSDWFGVYSVAESIKAGLDLEMPGPTYIRGQVLKHALGSGKVHQHEIDARVAEVLKLIKRLLPLDLAQDAEELTVDTPATAKLLRKLSADSQVLLKNDDSVLPFSKNRSTAVIGPNAAISAYCGGGSASLKPYYAMSPLEGVRAKVPDAQYELGAPGWKKLPLLCHLTRRISDNKPGLDMSVFREPPTVPDRELIDSLPISTSDIFLADYKHPKLTTNLFYLTFSATLTPTETAIYQFSLSVSGTGKLFIDGNCIIDNAAIQRPGDSFFGSGTVEEIGEITLQKDTTYTIEITFGTLPTRTFTVEGATAFGAGGLRAGAYRKITPADEIQRAVALAKEVDQVVLCAGLNSDWESEGYDRADMHLPPYSDDLIRAVVFANPNTVVIIQSGTPVTMPWIKESKAVIQSWYGGNETGNAIADVVFGDVNPSGKLPLSFPIRNEHNPAFLNFRSERGRTIYGEDVYVGYRFYEKTRREVAFPFGWGLSFTSFALDDLSIEEDGNDLVVSVTVTNVGKVDGAEVVQVYVSQKSPSIGRPVKELKGFAKVHLAPGEQRAVSVRVLKKYATSFWDERRDAWIQEAGDYSVLVGNSSVSVPLQRGFSIEETTWWKGL